MKKINFENRRKNLHDITDNRQIEAKKKEEERKYCGLHQKKEIRVIRNENQSNQSKSVRTSTQIERRRNIPAINRTINNVTSS